MKFAIIPPGPVITLNDRLHHFAEMRAKKGWRDAAFWSSQQARVPHLRDAQVCTISYPVRSLNQRRDPHNWVRTSKWIIDGLVLAKVLVDDDQHHLELRDAVFHPRSENPNVLVELVAAQSRAS